MLTPEFAKDYSNKTIRVITRDINALHEMGLIYKEHGKIKAKKDIIEAFKPWAKA
ncbi:hypothetical protein MNBD_GAMMA06-1204 [hydrothermal vent metagenome]|uniref:HTH deoR-type domain-containing protein n=1 Tax=hydrothermal vent metagenome TaxID=652676 RepID=A0A3B0WD65_9ZZZZ